MSSRPNEGQVIALRRRLELVPDPLALFARLTEDGTREGTVLLESAEPGNRQTQQSLLVTRVALRIECRGNEVTFTARSDNGRSLLPWLAGKLGSAAAGDHFIARFPPPTRSPDEETRRTAPHVLDALRRVVDSLSVEEQDRAEAIFLAGVFAYDLVDSAEALPPAAQDPLGFPDYVFSLAETLVLIDHRNRNARVVASVFGGAHRETSFHEAAAEVARIAELCGSLAPLSPVDATGVVGKPSVSQSDEEFAGEVERLKAHIVAGDVFQIVPSRTFSTPCSNPLAAYRALRSINPSPYLFYVRGDRWTLFGASPESAVKVDGASRVLEIAPIAGTRPRGVDAHGDPDLDLDSRLEAELRLDDKELAEHMMLVDLARNDVARVSMPGTRTVTELLRVVRYAHVMHLVSMVQGKLRPGLDALHAYQASMNMGTLTGAPKIRAMELLRRYEPRKRASYGGAVGYLRGDGSLDTAIVIRAALVKDGIAHVNAGAGVVHDSNPQAEADETSRKARAVLSAIAHAEAQHGRA